jgi:AraC-like DNA-binding protein
MIHPLEYDSSLLPIKQRTKYWSDVVCGLVGGIEIEPLDSAFLDGQMRISHLGQLRLSRVQLSHCRVLANADRTAGSGFAILFQDEGRSCFSQGSIEAEIGPGQCVAFDNSVPFVLENGAKALVHMVDIPYSMVVRKGLSFEYLSGAQPQDPSVIRLAHHALKGVEREIEALPAHLTVNIATTLTDMLLLPFIENRSKTSGLLRKADIRAQVRAYINDNLSDPMLSIARISDAVGCTKRYLHMLFKDEQTTLSRYIWSMRLQRSKEILENSGGTALSITDIAFSLGFSSSSHFSRLFFQEFGFLPSSLKSKNAKLYDVVQSNHTVQ